ncbi:hypothetical protein CHLRE_06g274600v5 [Chlamydomonas reinhardtii]|uniref:Uncharacterized protein n=1 Tax=Chlamydomonas reinhardtii TaxID=3055 RepID=A0A2K3DNK0_CHLRE|nr:uncharacterized protein CHLRE_06g274600v5 [Chlamydomonas reinhardtii]PNW82115.1 hypothetical protein CHLRE_06g274600v5 [Chlamydomonas reinhardtii]
MFSEKAPCIVLERKYTPSPLEARWVAAAKSWKDGGNGDVKDIAPYCQLLVDTLQDIKRMLQLVDTLMKSNTTLSPEPDADQVLSVFVTTMQCGPYQLTVKEHVESLVAALRHPFAIKCPAPFESQLPPQSDMFDKGYVLLAAWAGVQQAARNKFYLDAGSGIGYRANSNQFWMVENYAGRGLPLDRAIFFEAKTVSGAEPFKDVPPELFPVFQFYNMPAPESLADGRNLLNMVTRLAQPVDFVSVKLDIDAPNIEDAWLKAIRGDGKTPTIYTQLIDELFWEHHFNFSPMMTCCWGGLVDMASHLYDSMRWFQQLREMGVRSHYWQ